jgi:hypothetical protein
MCFRSEAIYIANMFCIKFKKSIKAMRRNVSGEEAGIYDTTGKSPYRTLGYPRISPKWKLLPQRFSEGRRQFRRPGSVGCCFSYFFTYFFTSIVNSAP